jgi:hypothetical protein
MGSRLFLALASYYAHHGKCHRAEGGTPLGLMRTLCGGWIKLCVGRASEADQSEPAHTFAFSEICDA